MRFSVILFLSMVSLHAATTGSISGTVTDVSGGVVPRASLTAISPATGVPNKRPWNTKGFYAFPPLPVGGFAPKIEAQGFNPQTRPGLMIDLDSALKVDIVLEVA